VPHNHLGARAGHHDNIFFHSIHLFVYYGGFPDFFEKKASAKKLSNKKSGKGKLTKNGFCLLGKGHLAGQTASGAGRYSFVTKRVTRKVPLFRRSGPRAGGPVPLHPQRG
ncbi:MAG: hypothetical protein PUF76_04410, partial [bacterium]|nr:hypothetical protein [bacterium]